jgi:hypothetical protein
MFEILGYILYAMGSLIWWSIIYAISYTTKLWLILWIFIGLSIMGDIASYSLLKDFGGFSIVNEIISLIIRGIFLYISYNLYKNPTESYTYVKVINNSSKTNPK